MYVIDFSNILPARSKDIKTQKSIAITVTSETLEGMFFLDYSVNIFHREAMIGTKVSNYLCDLFQ